MMRFTRGSFQGEVFYHFTGTVKVLQESSSLELAVNNLHGKVIGSLQGALENIKL